VQIEDYLGKLNPFDFQRLVSELLKAMGYFVTWVAPPGQDGGVDIIANTDPLGTTAPRIKVQVKRRADKTDVDTLKAFLSSLGDQDVGLFVCLSGFTKAAENTARSQEKRRITLVDLDRLVSLWIEHYKKLDETARRLLPLKPIYYLLPVE
jgi:restriction system protein